MTSEQRHEARYQRRKAERDRKRRERSEAVGTIAEAFNYRDLFLNGRKCCNGVRWKQSTQNFELHLFSVTASARRKIINGTWKPGKYVNFTLTERGKTRPIDAPHIRDRQVHKTLTQNVLAPLYGPSMIYDNGASQKGKGLHFHYRRLKEQLRWQFRRTGREGAVVLMDFHHFFPSAPHELLYERHRHWILNPEIRAIADAVVASAPGGVGLPLGVEPSQQEMVALPSALDNYLKCQMAIHGMGHYMDDYCSVAGSREQAEAIQAESIAMAERLGLQVNRSKSHIIDAKKPFRWCKAKFIVTDTGRVIVHGSRDGMKRARRKLNAFKPLVDSGEKTIQQAAEVLQSHIAYYENFNDNGRVLRLKKIFHAIYGGATNVQDHQRRDSPGHDGDPHLHQAPK